MVQAVAGGEQGRVEGFAVERDQRLRGRQELGNRFEHGRFLGRVAHEELPRSIVHKTQCRP
jgi:hypothetical protein